MGTLPSGTVTFLFTDIEGSTQLWEKHPTAMQRALAQHDLILRGAIESNSGHVIKTTGDGIHAVFEKAIDAVQATLSAQQSLRTPVCDLPIRIRMGLHSGEAELRDADYFGQVLNRAARIMAAGYGGQILLSSITAGLVRDHLPADASLLDLGEHQLKDLVRPEHLYQLAAPDLQQDFPAIKYFNNLPNNLPVQLTSFIGRENEINTLRKLIKENRIVTLTGSGGCGKTRLSIQIASEIMLDFTHGVWLVELAPLADPALVPQAIITTLKLREDSHRTSLQVLTDYLHTKSILLILDNCEHVIDACAQLSESLLRACPTLKILASSREALGIAGEASYRVPSLKTPYPGHLPSLAELRKLDSIRLFLERAAMIKPDFALTKDNASFAAQICRRLDGIPLAIELAAARIKVLSPEQIAARLDDRFRLLTGGARTALPRQQTLRAMIDWSYSLLSEQEKILLCRLAVFVGGWSLEAAESICAEERGRARSTTTERDVRGGGFEILDLLTRLVDKSLVNTEEVAGETRYNYLETIRQYSREKFFETDEVEMIRDRHLAFYVKFSEETEKQMQGRDRKVWAARSRAEEDNLNAAIEWGLARNPALSLQVAVNMLYAVTAGGFSVEGFRWLREGMTTMEATLTSIEPWLRAKTMRALAFLHISLGNNLDAKISAEKSIALYRQLEDKSDLAAALLVYSVSLEYLGELVEAEAAVKEGLALAQADKNDFIRIWGLNNLARITATLHRDMERAFHYTQEAIRVSQEAGITWQLASAYEMQGFIAAASDRYEEARAQFEKALLGFQDVGASFNVILNKSNLAHLERQFGHHQHALAYYRETILAFRDVGQLGAVAHQLECIGFIALAQHQDQRALQLFAAAGTLRETAGTPMRPEEQVYYDEQLQGLRRKMDKTQFESIWSQGRLMRMDQAIDFALETSYV